MSQNQGQNPERKQERKRTFGRSPELNQDLDGYAELQAAGKKNFAESIAASSQARGALSFDSLAQKFNDVDPTTLQAFAASAAYELYELPDDSVQRSVRKALSDTEGALAYNDSVSRSLPSNGLVPLIVAFILSKIVDHNTGVAQTTAPYMEDPLKEERAKQKIAEFILMKLFMNPSNPKPDWLTVFNLPPSFVERFPTALM